MPAILTSFKAWCVLLVFSLVCWAPLHDAHAEEDPLAKPTSSEARERLARGNKLYAIREFKAAIEEYKAGVLLEDAPVFQYNLAQAYRLAGEYEDALWHYDRFVKRAQPTGLLKTTIEQFVEQMKAELGKAASKQPPIEPAGGSASPDLAKPNQQVQPTMKRGHHREPSRLGWILTGSGSLALGGTAVAFHLWGDRTYEKAKAANVQSQRNSLESSANTRRYVAQGLGIAAVGCAGAAIYLYVRSRRSEATTIAPVASSQLAGLAVVGTW